MRILSIDYGTKRIGLAITDNLQKMAHPLKMVSAGASQEMSVDNILREVKSYFPEIEKIIVGMPYLGDNQKGAMAKTVDSFIEILRKKTDLPVITGDERLTSYAAESNLAEMQFSRKKRAKFSDSAAAALILQDYLEEQC